VLSCGVQPPPTMRLGVCVYYCSTYYKAVRLVVKTLFQPSLDSKQFKDSKGESERAKSAKEGAGLPKVPLKCVKCVKCVMPSEVLGCQKV
jgi:hypothetical protein